MNCSEIVNKKIGEDWNFFFKLKNEGGDFQDLNGYNYSYIIENEEGESDKSGNGTIGASGNELAITISGSETGAFSEGEKKVEFKITDDSGNIFISDVAKFYAKKTLHSSTS